MFTNLENVLNIFTCLYGVGYFFDREGFAKSLGKEFQNLALSLNNFASGLLASFHSWLVVGIDVDERSVNSHSPFEKGNQDSDDKW
jgi:hypothetical protein